MQNADFVEKYFSLLGITWERQKNPISIFGKTKIAMRQEMQKNRETSEQQSAYKLKLPRKKSIPERKKVRRILRAMLPMEEYQRQLKEEQNLF